jgi:hypothetical protein
MLQRRKDVFMRNQSLSIYDNKHSGEFYCPSIKWYESGINVLMMDEPSNSDKELKKLYQEAQEYDFLKCKTPKISPDYWEDED